MPSLHVSHTIRAPREEVFALFSDLSGLEERIRGISKIELLTGPQMAVGTRWRETRKFLGQSATGELEVTAFEPGASYTVTSRDHGTLYTSVFRFTDEGDGTRVAVDFISKPETLVARLLSPLGWLTTKSVLRLLVDDILDLKAVAEARSGTAD